MAAEPDLLVPDLSARAVKVDLFLTSVVDDADDARLQQLSTVLRCTPRARRAESCTFADGVWWSRAGAAGEQLEFEKLSAPGTLELTWTRRGRLASWDLVPAGPQDPSWSVILAGAPDLPRWIAGALEWELPKDGAAERWAPTQPPSLARTHEATPAGQDITVTVTGRTERTTELAMSGTTTERWTGGGSLAYELCGTAIEGDASFDRQQRRVTRTQVRVRTACRVPETVLIAVMGPWSEGESKEPAPLPEP